MTDPHQAELDGILDDLRRGFDGDAWHGPPLLSVLEGVDAAAANAVPAPLAHSIHAIVLHLAAWDEVVVRRIADRLDVELPDAGNFPPVPDATEETWAASLRELTRRHAALVDLLADLDPARLAEPVAGKPYSIAHMLRGELQHHAYHAGQIALLRKLVRQADG